MQSQYMVIEVMDDTTVGVRVYEPLNDAMRPLYSIMVGRNDGGGWIIFNPSPYLTQNAVHALVDFGADEVIEFVANDGAIMSDADYTPWLGDDR